MMTDKVKDSLRKALELAMENSENITITQSNKVIAQVKDKEWLDLNNVRNDSRHGV